jgi:hypothetical protein
MDLIRPIPSNFDLPSLVKSTECLLPLVSRAILFAPNHSQGQLTARRFLSKAAASVALGLMLVRKALSMGSLVVFLGC